MCSESHHSYPGIRKSSVLRIRLVANKVLIGGNQGISFVAEEVGNSCDPNGGDLGADCGIHLLSVEGNVVSHAAWSGQSVRMEVSGWPESSKQMPGEASCPRRPGPPGKQRQGLPDMGWAQHVFCIIKLSPCSELTLTRQPAMDSNLPAEGPVPSPSCMAHVVSVKSLPLDTCLNFLGALFTCITLKCWGPRSPPGMGAFFEDP